MRQFFFLLCFPAGLPYWQIRSQWVPRVLFLLYPFTHFGFSDACFVFVRYTKSSVKVPFHFFLHLLARSLTNSLFPMHSLCVFWCVYSSVHQRFMCFNTSSRVFLCIPPPECLTGTRLFPWYACYPFAMCSLMFADSWAFLSVPRVFPVHVFRGYVLLSPLPKGFQGTELTRLS